MENNTWGGVEKAKEELREDINNLNNMIYNTTNKETPEEEKPKEYHRERIRVDANDYKEQARINYNIRQQKRQREKQMQEILRTKKQIETKRGGYVNINNLKEKFNTNPYIKDNSRKLGILPSLQEFYENKKQAIIAGTIAGILAITTIAYSEFQRHSFEEHTESNSADYIVPTKEEFDAGLSQEQLEAKRQQTKVEEETINKIINHEEVTPEQIRNITTQENIQINPMTK